MVFCVDLIVSHDLSPIENAALPFDTYRASWNLNSFTAVHDGVSNVQEDFRI